jgi:cob(I)alamin adenosyltransferase
MIRSRCRAVASSSRWRTLPDTSKSCKKAEQQIEEWQDAVEALLLVVNQNGPTMFARIGVMRALNRHVERVFDLSRKDKHWGRRKLKRDTP